MHASCSVDEKRFIKTIEKVIDDAEEMCANAENIAHAKSTQYIDAVDSYFKVELNVRLACAAAGMARSHVYDVYYKRIGHTPETIATVSRIAKEDEYMNADTEDECENASSDDQDDVPLAKRRRH
jgi:hypothetical protein